MAGNGVTGCSVSNPGTAGTVPGKVEVSASVEVVIGASVTILLGTGGPGKKSPGTPTAGVLAASGINGGWAGINEGCSGTIGNGGAMGVVVYGGGGLVGGVVVLGVVLCVNK